LRARDQVKGRVELFAGCYHLDALVVGGYQGKGFIGIKEHLGVANGRPIGVAEDDGTAVGGLPALASAGALRAANQRHLDVLAFGNGSGRVTIEQAAAQNKGEEKKGEREVEAKRPYPLPKTRSEMIRRRLTQLRKRVRPSAHHASIL